MSNKQDDKSAKNKQGKKDKSQNKKGGKGGNGKKETSNQNSALAYQNDMQEELLERLDMLFEETPYCREGYIELEVDVKRGLSKLKGECHESATDEDRQRFPNTH